MRLWGYLLVCFSGLITLATAGVDPCHAEMIERMKAGGHILMIRHALAPGTGDPANFRIGDCSTQRNLDDRGRRQAKAIGCAQMVLLQPGFTQASGAVALKQQNYSRWVRWWN